MAAKDLRNKRILITAGPTWVAIDKVRVISNSATGQTGILLAEGLSRLGAEVTLLLGPVNACCLSPKIKVKGFNFFDDLSDLIGRELRSKKFDAVIQSAAVSDYRPRKSYKNKISSDKELLKIELVPTEKIINKIKKIDPSLFLVGFKFEPDASKATLIKGAIRLMRGSKADLVVANGIKSAKYEAYIVTGQKVSAALTSKKVLVMAIIKEIKEGICKN